MTSLLTAATSWSAAVLAMNARYGLTVSYSTVITAWRPCESSAWASAGAITTMSAAPARSCSRAVATSGVTPTMSTRSEARPV